MSPLLFCLFLDCICFIQSKTFISFYSITNISCVEYLKILANVCNLVLAAEYVSWINISCFLPLVNILNFKLALILSFPFDFTIRVSILLCFLIDFWFMSVCVWDERRYALKSRIPLWFITWSTAFLICQPVLRIPIYDWSSVVPCLNHSLQLLALKMSAYFRVLDLPSSIGRWEFLFLSLSCLCVFDLFDKYRQG